MIQSLIDGLKNRGDSKIISEEDKKYSEKSLLTPDGI